LSNKLFMKFKSFITKNIIWVIAGILTVFQSAITNWIIYLGQHNCNHCLFKTSPLWIFYTCITGFFFIFFQALCLFVLPTKIIFLISKGTPFDKSNVRNLNAIAAYLLLYDIADLIHSIIGNFILNTASDKNVFTHWSDYGIPPHHWKLYLLAGSIVFIIARAFKKGYELQKEQELTI